MLCAEQGLGETAKVCSSWLLHKFDEEFYIQLRRICLRAQNLNYLCICYSMRHSQYETHAGYFPIYHSNTQFCVCLKRSHSIQVQS